MGQKVNPHIFRIGSIKTWDSKWFVPRKEYCDTVHEDIKLRKAIAKKLPNTGISKVEILRNANQITVNIHSAKPGVIIGGQGSKIEKLKNELEKEFRKKLNINVMEVKKPNTDAQIVVENIAKQIENRISYRRAAKMAVERALESGALGARVQVAGRLNGVEIARSEHYSKGKVPLHTIRADVDYAFMPANTTYGVIGVKVWINRGEVFGRK